MKIQIIWEALTSSGGPLSFLRRGKVVEKAVTLTSGDRTMIALNIPNATVGRSVTALLVLLGLHSAGALLGLVAFKPRYQKPTSMKGT